MTSRAPQSEYKIFFSFSFSQRIFLFQKKRMQRIRGKIEKVEKVEKIEK
jgi:hypothetical protein